MAQAWNLKTFHPLSLRKLSQKWADLNPSGGFTWETNSFLGLLADRSRMLTAAIGIIPSMGRKASEEQSQHTRKQIQKVEQGGSVLITLFVILAYLPMIHLTHGSYPEPRYFLKSIWVSITCNSNYSDVYNTDRGFQRWLRFLKLILSTGCILCLIKIYLSEYAYKRCKSWRIKKMNTA